jgi:hypothetical protein
MNIKQFAEKLNGREYLREITPEEERQAKDLGYAVIFGYSDDLAEIRGTDNGEAGCYGGGTFYITRDGKILENECGDEDCPYFEKEKEKCLAVRACWCEEEEYSWTFEQDIDSKFDFDYEVFDIFDDDEKFCQGIVIDLKSAREKDYET